MTTKRGGKPSAAQLAKRKLDEAQAQRDAVKQARYDAQESRRAVKVQIDQNVVLIAWLVAVGVAFLASAVISFNGITSVASFVGLAADWQGYLFFFFVELLYLIFLVAFLVLSSRVDDVTGKPESNWGALVGMVFFAGVSIYSNFIHTGIHNNWDWSSVETYTGLVLSVAAPIAIISASKLASRVIFAKAVSV